MAAKVAFKILSPIYLSQIKKELPDVSCFLSRNAPHSWSRTLIDSCQADPPELTQQRFLGQCTPDWWAQGGKATGQAPPQESKQQGHKLSDPPVSFWFLKCSIFTEFVQLKMLKCLMNLSDLQSESVASLKFQTFLGLEQKAEEG